MKNNNLNTKNFLKISIKIKKYLSIIINKNFKNFIKNNFITITNIKLNKNSKEAKIYFIIFKKNIEVIKNLINILNYSSFYFRNKISKILNTYTIPKFIFKYDENMLKSIKLINLIKIANKNNFKYNINKI